MRLLSTFIVISILLASNLCAAQNSPVANDDYFTVQKNQTTLLPVTSNDFDADGDSLTVSLLSVPMHGTALLNFNLISYSPTNGFTGNDTLNYLLCQTGTNDCDSAFVFIVVDGSNTAPTASLNEAYFGDTLSAALIDIGASDADGDSIFIGSILNTDSANPLGNLLPQDLSLIFIRSGLACGSKTFLYTLCDATLCDTFQITIHIVCPEAVFLPEGFSPDGDGINDKLVFKGIDYFGPAKLKVLNRYGTLVYDNEDYKNEWDGTANDSGKALPDGTYFYTLQLANGRNYSKYLIINR
ncbi:MAG: gliding motility-associated C-terminal domain-containing protein [Bacteroidetes bacterium]|nr:gliding motility-associated C-terminal domain-containing protein [Bacteroidota bacterium]